MYEASEVIGRASMALEVKKTVIFEPVFPLYDSGNSHWAETFHTEEITVNKKR